ncbi:AP-1 complex subunit sigma-3 [Crocuta crocuta]
MSTSRIAAGAGHGPVGEVDTGHSPEDRSPLPSAFQKSTYCRLHAVNQTEQNEKQGREQPFRLVNRAESVTRMGASDSEDDLTVFAASHIATYSPYDRKWLTGGQNGITWGNGGRKIHFILLFSRQGKLRLQKWYTTLPDKERKKITREIVQIILSRSQRTSSFVDWKELKLVYKRYASLYFCCAVENQDNELLTLEIVHRYVELLDKYFGNVCELDIIFNFEKAYFILDEFIMGGEIQETSKKSAVKAIEDSDMLQETMEEYMNKPTF